MREDGVVLKHHVGRAVVWRHLGHRCAVYIDLTGGRRLKAGQHSEQGGLATTRGTEQREEFAAADSETEVIDCHHRAEVLGHVS